MKRSIVLALAMVLVGNIYAVKTVETTKLLIKIPTRWRPEQFFKMLDLYYEKLSGEVPYLFLITCDDDDATMNNETIIAKFKSYPNLAVHFGPCATKIEAYNRDIDKHPDFDIVLVTSDDMEPKAQGYDKIIVNRMLESFPDFDGVLHFYDGYRTGDINTLPVIGKKFYDRFGYIYHPGYKSACCDCELTEVSRMLNRERILSEVIIVHRHPENFKEIKWDALYLKNGPPYYAHDLPFWEQRKRQKFGLTQEYIKYNRR